MKDNNAIRIRKMGELVISGKNVNISSYVSNELHRKNRNWMIQVLQKVCKFYDTITLLLQNQNMNGSKMNSTPHPLLLGKTKKKIYSEVTILKVQTIGIIVHYHVKCLINKTYLQILLL